MAQERRAVEKSEKITNMAKTKSKEEAKAKEKGEKRGSENLTEIIKAKKCSSINKSCECVLEVGFLTH